MIFLCFSERVGSINGFPTKLSSQPRLFSAAQVQALRLKKKYDAFVGDVTKEKNYNCGPCPKSEFLFGSYPRKVYTFNPSINLNWEGAIFDWDGVIVDSSDLHQKSWEALAVELNLPLPSDHFEKGFGKRNETIIPEILKWTQDCSQIEAWGKRKEELYRKMAKYEGIKLAPGAFDFLTKTNLIGIKCSIGSSTERKNIQLAIEQHDLSKFFKGAACSEDVKKGKPDPEVFLPLIFFR